MTNKFSITKYGGHGQLKLPEKLDYFITICLQNTCLKYFQ